jgi:hypothetical protein
MITVSFYMRLLTVVTVKSKYFNTLNKLDSCHPEEMYCDEMFKKF